MLLDLEPAVGCLGNVFRDRSASPVNGVQRLRPTCRQPPFDGRHRLGDGGLGNGSEGRTGTRGGQELSASHLRSPPCGSCRPRQWRHPAPAPARCREALPKKVVKNSEFSLDGAMPIHPFGRFRLDAGAEILFRDGEPVPLGRRAVALLRVLVERSGTPVSKDALIGAPRGAAWAVEDSNLTVQISALRREFSKEAGGEHWIETLPGRGYRFLGPKVVRMTAARPRVNRRTKTRRDQRYPKSRRCHVPFTNTSGDPNRNTSPTAWSRKSSPDCLASNGSRSYLAIPASSTRIQTDAREGRREQAWGPAMCSKAASARRGTGFGLPHNLSTPRPPLISGLKSTTDCWRTYSRSRTRSRCVLSAPSSRTFGGRRSIVSGVSGPIPSTPMISCCDHNSLFLLDVEGKPATAIPLLEEALRLEPDYSAAHAYLGWCYHALFGRGGLREEDRLAAIRHAPRGALPSAMTMRRHLRSRRSFSPMTGMILRRRSKSSTGRWS